jgi:hypothetical protein
LIVGIAPVLEALIKFLISNFSLTFLIIILVAGVIGLLSRSKSRSPVSPVEPFLAFFLLFSIGFYYLSNFVVHVFFGEMTARFIGWEQSPFQAEVGFASLGFAVVGFLAFRGSFGLRLAAIVGPACFLWGAAGGHVYQMVSAGNFAPGNSGIVFYTDILLPIIGFALLWLRYGAGGQAPRSDS